MLPSVQNRAEYIDTSCRASTRSKELEFRPWCEQLKRLKHSLRVEQKNWFCPQFWAKTLTTNYIHISVSAFPAAAAPPPPLGFASPPVGRNFCFLL